MDAVNDFLNQVNNYIGSNAGWFPFVLLGTGIFFTIYLKFPQIRFFRHAISIVSGKYEKDEFEGDTTHFQSLTTALSGTVGTGNIAGVGLALFMGGPAALFWMWATAFFGMCLKFVECTLSHKYREVESDGSIAGGPMFYMQNKLNMKWLAVVFAIATVICSFGTGNLPQINNIAVSIKATFGLSPWITGGILSVLLALIIVGGIKRIAAVTEKVVPFMAIIYIIGALTVILANPSNIISSFSMIVKQVFTGSAAMGGFIGASFVFALTNGVSRGIYSNEAGQGSAAIAHSAAKADEPVSEGMVSILEPFIDTLLICTLTGLAIMASGSWNEKVHNSFQRADLEIVQGVWDQDNQDHLGPLTNHINNSSDDAIAAFDGSLQLLDGHIVEGQDVTVIHARSVAEDVHFIKSGEPITGTILIDDGLPDDTDIELDGRSLVHSARLTTEAFQKGWLGESGKYIVSIGLLLFAFSTVISWSYYGDRAITYLVGLKYVVPYRVVYIIAFFAAALADTTIIWTIANIAIVLMAIPNLFGIIMLHKDMRQSVDDYWVKFKIEHPEDAAKMKIK
ncbi:sodium:alanine symporter family protein [bacterium]|nr:sodium:alanine symporter family protein [bacterium]